jgi:hypothetical protein
MTTNPHLSFATTTITISLLPLTSSFTSSAYLKPVSESLVVCLLTNRQKTKSLSRKSRERERGQTMTSSRGISYRGFEETLRFRAAKFDQKKKHRKSHSTGICGFRVVIFAYKRKKRVDFGVCMTSRTDSFAFVTFQPLMYVSKECCL